MLVERISNEKKAFRMIRLIVCILHKEAPKQMCHFFVFVRLDNLFQMDWLIPFN